MTIPTQSGNNLHLRAAILFDELLRRGNQRGFFGKITGNAREMPLLNESFGRGSDIPILKLGQKAVPVEMIRGSVNSRVLDRDFLPTKRTSQARWTGIAEAMMNHPGSLPPVDLVKAGEFYWVSDGNHRVSIARALGYHSIDANVTEWVIDAKR